jgi:hypothetical protein
MVVEGKQGSKWGDIDKELVDSAHEVVRYIGII